MSECLHECRLCGSRNLFEFLDLGEMTLTGIFPRSREEIVPRHPLSLVKCVGECGLVQLASSAPLELMYGDRYGYRSGLTRSMTSHLRARIGSLIEALVSGDTASLDLTDLGARRFPMSFDSVRGGSSLRKDDIVLDIGSNDGTSLSAYPSEIVRIGIDPTARKFRQFYDEGIVVFDEFFPSEKLLAYLAGRKVRVVTSYSCFYDLRDPLSFARSVGEILAENGLWQMEQGYLPMTIDRGAYDTVCHEHLEYYAFKQIDWICKQAGLKVVGVETNDVNGGSFAVTVAKRDSVWREATEASERMLQAERFLGFDTAAPYVDFEQRVKTHIVALRNVLVRVRSQGKSICGYGASTKGNVILQAAGVDPSLVAQMAEINEDKFGAFTPGTLIPIVADAEARKSAPGVFLVMTWHYRDGVLAKEREYLRGGGRLIFPLPTIQVI